MGAVAVGVFFVGEVAGGFFVGPGGGIGVFFLKGGGLIGVAEVALAVGALGDELTVGIVLFF